MKKWLANANAPDYNDVTTVTTVKSFIRNGVGSEVRIRKKQ